MDVLFSFLGFILLILFSFLGFILLIYLYLCFLRKIFDLTDNKFNKFIVARQRFNKWVGFFKDKGFSVEIRIARYGTPFWNMYTHEIAEVCGKGIIGEFSDSHSSKLQFDSYPNRHPKWILDINFPINDKEADDLMKKLDELGKRLG